jgi:hypothetical protein
MLEYTPREISATETSPTGTAAYNWLWANRIRIVGVLMVGAQILWMATFLTRSFFRLDDFYYLETGLSSGLTWKYLTFVDLGHLTPVAFAISWVLVRISPMDWTLSCAVTLALLACAGLALLRLLRTLFGDHPGILLLMLGYLVSPLSFPGLSWWSVSLELVPLEIAMFCALTSHVRYVRIGTFRHAVATALWLVLAMASSIKGAGVPLLLLAITSAWLVEGSWAAGLVRTLRKHWRAWVMYGVILGGYLAVYVGALRASGQRPTRPGAFSGVFGYIREIIANTFVPGMLGGPWNWLGTPNWTGNAAFHGEYAAANPPTDLLPVAWAVAAAIIALSIWQQPKAWRAWAIVLGWLVVIDTIPGIGRLSDLPAALLSRETRYVMDAVGVLVICAGLAFLPQTGQEVTRPHRIARARPTTAVVVGLATAVLIGSLVSYHNYLADTSNVLPRDYFATASAALVQAPPGTQIVTETAPLYVTDGSSSALGSEVKLLGPLRTAPGLARFISSPKGTIDQLLMFNAWGQLVHAQVIGAGSTAPQCFPVSKDGVTRVRLEPLPAGETADELRFGYLSGRSGQVAVSYAGQSVTVGVLRGLHSAFVPVQAQGAAVTFSGMNHGFCIGDVEVGQLWPKTTDPSPIPAQPVGG